MALSLYWKMPGASENRRRQKEKQHDKRSDIDEWQVDKARIRAAKKTPTVKTGISLFKVELPLPRSPLVCANEDLIGYPHPHTQNVAIPLLNHRKSGYMGAKSLTIMLLRLVMALINLVLTFTHWG